MRTVGNVEIDVAEEMSFTNYLLYTFAHTYNLHLREIVRDNAYRYRECHGDDTHNRAT
jgi:hypothetical protein